MRFAETQLKDAWLIEAEPFGDERGRFARVFCRKEFEAHGVDAEIVQANTSYSRDAGTLRGLHYQKAPLEEAKIMRCTRGSVFDVMIDVRPESPTYMKHFGVELSAANLRMVYVPGGFAHGFLTLEDHSEVTYLVDQCYAPESEDGVRYDDPAFGIQWPREVVVVSDKDRSWPNFKAAC